MLDTKGAFVSADGAELWYEMAGAGDPVVFVHAGIVDGGMWDPQITSFSERHRVIRYDQRGFGRSTTGSGDVSLTEDLEALLRFLRVERADLVGASLGGTVVLDLALARPDLVGALVLVASGLPGYRPPVEAKLPRDELEARVRRGDLDGAAELLLRVWVDGPRRAPAEVEAGVRARARSMAARVASRLVEMGRPRWLEPQADARLHELRVPTLVIVGDGDQPSAIDIAERLASRIPAARKVVMAGPGHLPNLERPADFNALVLDFLDGART